MQKPTPAPLLVAATLLAACGGVPPTDAFAPHTLGTPANWGVGIDGFSTGLPGGRDSGGPGGSPAFDGTWEGTYTVTNYLSDYGVTCEYASDLTMVIDGGDIIVGFANTSAADCGISTQPEFSGSVGTDGAASGLVDEGLSYFYSVPWTGTFTADQGDGSFAEVGLTTSQGATDVSGTFTVFPTDR